MIQNSSFTLDIGHLVIVFLLYIVEEGKLEGVALSVRQIREFIYHYIKNLGESFDDEISKLDELIEFLITRLQGAKSNGEAILFRFFDGEQKRSKSAKINYIDYDVRMDGYKITEKGLEFLIMSKEIPQDARLTVSLYLFKLQLEKKKYKSALLTIRSINMETMRQLNIKESILTMNRLGHEDAARMYSDYWNSFYDIRKEETDNYNDAKQRLSLYRDNKYIKENEISLTLDEMETLAAIENEMERSARLQSAYTSEIAKMSGEMLDIDKRSLVNEFREAFNLRLFFNEITKIDSPAAALHHSLQPLFLPKRRLFFGLNLAFAQQTVIKKRQTALGDVVDEQKREHLNKGKLFNARVKASYCSAFKQLVIFLTEIRNPITDINDFIEFVSNGACVDVRVASADFLSFLFRLCSMPDEIHYHDVESENAQLFMLARSKKVTESSIDKMYIQELLSHFWFNELDMKNDCRLEIATQPDKVVYLDDKRLRSIGNIIVKLTEV